MAQGSTLGATSHSFMDLGLVGIVLALTDTVIHDTGCLVCGKYVDTRREHYEVEVNVDGQLCKRTIHNSCWGKSVGSG